ncbi:MAG: hypothetical protein ACYTBP_15690, partial [Planctomycetota bacterium]
AHNFTLWVVFFPALQGIFKSSFSTAQLSNILLSQAKPCRIACIAIDKRCSKIYRCGFTGNGYNTTKAQDTSGIIRLQKSGWSISPNV